MKAALILASCLLFFLLVLYIFCIQEIIKKEYTLSRSQAKLETLSRQAESLGKALSFSSFVQQAEKEAQNLGFVKVKAVKYLSLSAGALAQNPR